MKLTEIVSTFTRKTRIAGALAVLISGSVGGAAAIPGFPFPDDTDMEFPDDTPAILFMSNPVTGDVNVPLNAPVSFTFLTAMAPDHRVTWSPNVTAANFNYAWSADKKTLTCTYNESFPANATINWTLDPEVFKSASGAALLPFNNSGSFTTGSSNTSTNGPCEGGGGIGDIPASFGVFKSFNYIQTNANAPVLRKDLSLWFSANYTAKTNETVTSVTVRVPGGATIELVSNPFFPRNFSYFKEFNTDTAMNAEFAAGTYTFNVTRQGGATVSASLTLASAEVPVPRLTNFDEVKTFNAAQPTTFRWAPFTGVGPNDWIQFDINDKTGASFQAPDSCVPRELPNTATSILVPANSLRDGTDYEGSLTFYRISSVETNAIPGSYGSAGVSRTTEFNVEEEDVIVPDPEAPIFTAFNMLANGAFQFELTGEANVLYRIDVSSDFNTWIPLLLTNSSTGVILHTDTTTTGTAKRYYRAEVAE